MGTFEAKITFSEMLQKRALATYIEFGTIYNIYFDKFSIS